MKNKIFHKCLQCVEGARISHYLTEMKQNVSKQTFLYISAQVNLQYESG